MTGGLGSGELDKPRSNLQMSNSFSVNLCLRINVVIALLQADPMTAMIDVG